MSRWDTVKPIPAPPSIVIYPRLVWTAPVCPRCLHHLAMRNGW